MRVFFVGSRCHRRADLQLGDDHRKLMVVSSARGDLAQKCECFSTSQLTDGLIVLIVDGWDGQTFPGAPESVQTCRSCVFDGWMMEVERGEHSPRKMRRGQNPIDEDLERFIPT
jgi:hypothetical protein